jgi:hypothetical protein
MNGGAAELVQLGRGQHRPFRYQRAVQLGGALGIHDGELRHVGVEVQLDPLQQDGMVDRRVDRWFPAERRLGQKLTPEAVYLLPEAMKIAVTLAEGPRQERSGYEFEI